MGLLARRSFPAGWVPDADLINGPADALLRADNLIFDEIGAVALRPGSARVNATPFADTDVHSLFTAVLSGTRYRMAGAGDAVYANGTRILSGVAGSGDLAFGSYLGEIFFARGSTTKKYDGTLRTWGVPMTGSAPTAAALDPDGKTFATCDSTESPAFTAPSGTTISFVTGEDGTTNGAIQAENSAGATQITKLFASDQDFTSYDSGGTGEDTDLLQIWVQVTDPTTVQSIVILIDVNGGGFKTDLYYYVLRPNTVIPLFPTAQPTSTGTATDAQLQQALATQAAASPGPASQVALSTAGWNLVQIPRGSFTRIGATPGKGWNTVRAIRLQGNTTGGSSGAVAYDAIRIVGGSDRQLTGTNLQWCYVYAYNNGSYVGLSAPSPLSSVTSLQNGAVTVTVPADGSRDSQVNEIWLFRIGGTLPTLYRVAVQTDVSGTGSVAIADTASDVTALLDDLPLQPDNTTPPANIIGLAGPYYDRLFVLTSDGLVWPSRQVNPESFATGQAITVTGPDETPYWIVKAAAGLLVGTSKDIYQIAGTGAEQPDGTVDFTLQPFNIDHPPISAATAQDGNQVVYLANDGWRGMPGLLGGSQSLVGGTSLLYKGYTRHGVQPVNLASGRFRAALVKGQFVAITPEGTDVDSSSVVYRLRMGAQWMRHGYAWPLRSLLREPDGTLLAGDTLGYVHALDTGTSDDGVAIGITLWTKADDSGAPLTEKESTNLNLSLDTGNAAASITLLRDGTANQIGSLTVSADGPSELVTDATGMGPWRQVQLQFGGGFTTFTWRGFALSFLGLPTAVRAWDSGPVDLGVNELIWLRALRLKVRASADLTATLAFDGATQATIAIPVAASVLNHTTILIVPLPRGLKGGVLRITLRSAANFYPYWIDLVRRTTGPTSQKPALRVSCGLGGERAA